MRGVAFYEISFGGIAYIYTQTNKPQIAKHVIVFKGFQYKEPRTLHTQLQKMCSYLPYTLHTTTFFHNCNDFFNSFLYDFLRKIFAVMCVVCKGLKVIYD